MNDQATTALGGTGGRRAIELSYDGRPGEIGKIAFVNSLLGLLTLGIYRFWAKTRLRRYLWSHVTMDGDRFEYTGRGIELFIGFLIAGLFLGLLFGVVFAGSILLDQGPGTVNPLEFIYVLVIVFLIPFALYRARRYRLSRTRWRGIRAGQTGSAVKYAFMTLGLQILLVFTLSLTYPLYRTILQRYRTTNTWFGDQRLDFDGRAGPMFGKWLLTLLLYIPTLGFSYFWYRTAEFRYYASETRYAGLALNSNLEAGRVIGIILLSSIASLLFIGLMFPVFMVALNAFAPGLAEAGGAAPPADPARLLDPALIAVYVILAIVVVTGLGFIQTVLLLHPMTSAIIDSLRLEGTIDFEALRQRAGEGPRHGEGLADAFDLSPI
ncbi:MAG: DUF898 domain-containing protein [Kiloniellales bacterium]|nr:DUF898 domain-containing protein [Kiloniellales bacterium]